MAQLHDITQAQAKQAEASPIDLHVTQQQTGCTSASAAYGAYFCDYTLAVMQDDSAYSKAWNQLQGKGGLTIYTTLDPKDQHAADDAVNYMLPPPPSADNPGGDVGAEVLIPPGTGDVAVEPLVPVTDTYHLSGSFKLAPQPLQLIFLRSKFRLQPLRQILHRRHKLPRHLRQLKAPKDSKE